jgi:hypothetical protein
MTPAQIIAEARITLNDTDSVAYRQSDAEMLAYVQDGIAEASVIRPEWFQSNRSMLCATGTVEQSLTFADAQAIVRVLGITGGSVVTPFDMPTLDAFKPAWKTDAAAAARQWSAWPGDILRFYVYPKAPAAQYLDVLYLRNPVTLALGDTITDVPESTRPALVAYTIYRAESKDDEHSVSGRATASYNQFIALIKGASA